MMGIGARTWGNVALSTSFCGSYLLSSKRLVNPARTINLYSIQQLTAADFDEGSDMRLLALRYL